MRQKEIDMLAITMPEVIDDPKIIRELHRFCGGRLDWAAEMLREHNDHIEDQELPLRPELAKAWTEFRPSLRRATACLWLDPRRSWSRLRPGLKDFFYDLAAAFFRADDQEHRLAPTKFACRHIGHACDWLFLKI
jgi:hypothetical protein